MPIDEKLDSYKKHSELLATFINKDINLNISYKARFLGIKHRLKVEFLKSFIV